MQTEHGAVFGTPILFGNPLLYLSFGKKTLPINEANYERREFSASTSLIML